MTELRRSATITVSSEYSGSYVKANAVDGNTGTSWASFEEGASSWIKFTWASPVTIREIRIINRVDQYGYPRFTFDDDSYISWNTNLITNATRTFVMPSPVTTTSVKISVSGGTTGLNTGFVEVYINDAYSNDPPTTLTDSPDMVLTASSAYSAEYSKEYALDATAFEWACFNDSSAAWIQFTWPTAVTFASVQLWDRSGVDRWGTPKFIFDDASVQNGGEAVSNAGFTTYTLTPKSSTSIRIGVLSGSNGANIGLRQVVLVEADAPTVTEIISGATLLTEIAPASAGKASGALLLSELSPASFGKISAAMLLVEITDSPNPFGIIPTTLASRSTAATMRTKRKTYATLNEREAALTLEDRP